MKFAIILALICCALLLGGCADNSLVTDEEYNNSKGPAPHAPDYAAQILGNTAP